MGIPEPGGMKRTLIENRQGARGQLSAVASQPQCGVRQRLGILPPNSLDEEVIQGPWTKDIIPESVVVNRDIFQTMAIVHKMASKWSCKEWQPAKKNDGISGVLAAPTENIELRHLSNAYACQGHLAEQATGSRPRSPRSRLLLPHGPGPRQDAPTTASVWAFRACASLLRMVAIVSRWRIGH